MASRSDDYLLRPDPADPRLTERVRGVDQTGAPVETSVTVERALTIFLNSQEIVTAMTINDYPEYLALGYLLNQNMLRTDDQVTGVDYDEELAIVVVRTQRPTDYEARLKKKVAPLPGCDSAQIRPPCLWMIRCTVARPIPVPANSRASWNRWKAPNILPA